ncbi:DEAD/DEAH box helicase [Aliarcobacter cryaerophilus]|uniref:DEAD/DEAH box helicase n=1 Tax=Aliarcobacter cryaerophilus TaxID=28198 RepID=UPI0021B4AE37|nr:DEAD/DEAH box helicase [Aliarcobacter cryaerophilus]MCT7464891.1 DEAD/DEAH box helicase [Aliarcobacter cryaerophilus]
MNKIELRDYQKDIITRAIKSKGNILIQAPTGSGKTVIAEEIVKFHKDADKKTLFLAPKINLLEQTAKAFANLNPQIIHGSNKEEIDTQAHSFVSTIQTISRRVDFLSSMNFDYIIFDEMHYGVKGKMQEIIKNIHKGKIIGLSATPYDEEGKLLTEDFDVIIDDYDARYMVDNGYLVNIKSFEAFTPNLSGIKTKIGDWDMNELDFRFNKPEIVNKIVSATKDILKNRDKTIVFCINISHAEAICKSYNEVKLKSEVTHSNISKENQKKILDNFKNGDTKVLVSVDQLTTGFDVPQTDTIVIARPTQSQNLYKQIVGRALRLSPQTNKKEAILLDCGGVVSRLGLPLEPIKEILKQDEIVRKPYCCKKCKSVKPRYFKINNNYKKPVTICPDCKDEIDFKPKFIYKCTSCNRYYDFKMDYSNFSFKNENMSLNCVCGFVNNLGSLNDDNIDFRELSNELQTEFNIERLNSNDISEESLDELSKNPEFIIRKMVSRHTNLSTKTLIQMAKDDFEVFDSIEFLNNKKITKEALLEIVEHKKNYVYYKKINSNSYSHMLFKSITHPKCTNKLIDTILKYTDINLLKFIIKFLSSVEKTPIQKRHYLERAKFYIQKLDDKFVNNVERFLEIASENPELKMDVAANEYISLKLLKKLAKDNDNFIRNIIQKNPNFSNEMLDEEIENQDYYSREILSNKKGLTKEQQLNLAKSIEPDIKINLLKNYKSKDVFFACLDSIPLKNEQIKTDFDFVSVVCNEGTLMKEILKSKHCNSDVIENLIETKHDSYTKYIS